MLKKGKMFTKDRYFNVSSLKACKIPVHIKLEHNLEAYLDIHTPCIQILGTTEN